MRALVSGGAGFIGSNLVDALVADGVETHVLDNLSTGKRDNLEGALERGARLQVGDVSDPEFVREAFAATRPEVVYHLAAQVDVRRSVDDPSFDARVNVGGTAAVLEGARAAGARRVLLASTSAVYGDVDTFPVPESSGRAPISPYGAGKAAAELYMDAFRRLYGLSTLCLRLANVYGPRQDPHGEAGVVAIFCGAAAGSRSATIFGDGLQTRDYIYVADVVAAFRAAATSDAAGSLNIGTGLETNLLELVAELGISAEHAPARAGEIARSSLDPTAAHAALGWRAATPLSDGLERTLAWAR